MSTMTSYFMPAGVGLIAEPGKAIKLVDVTDGTSNTVLLVDAGYPIGPWAAPTDFDLSPGAYTIGVGGTIQPRNGQVTVLFADGSTQSYDVASFPLMQLQSMFTRAGGEVVNRY
jgi:prepilin-type processing-associated H-X9-DG protein